MKKPFFDADGKLHYAVELDQPDALLSTCAKFLKSLVQNDTNGEVEGYSHELKAAFAQIALTFNQLFPDESFSNDDVTVFFEHDIYWMDLKVQQEINEGLQTFFDIYNSADDWTDDRVEVALSKMPTGNHAIVIQTSGSMLEEGEIEDDEEYEALMNVPLPTGDSEEELEAYSEALKNAFVPPQSPIESTGVSLKDIPHLLGGKSLENTLGEGMEIDSLSVWPMVNDMIEAVAAMDAYRQPLTVNQWKEVKDILFGAGYLLFYGKQADETCTLTELAEFMHNEDGRTQNYAAVYLLTQNLRFAHTDTNVPHLDEVCAFLRFLDWYGRPKVENASLFAFNTIAHMIDLMSDKA